MLVIVTCKNEKYPIKKKAIEWPQHYTLIFQTLKGSELLVSGEVFSKFKNEKDPFKNVQEWSQHFSHCKSMEIF